MKTTTKIDTTGNIISFWHFFYIVNVFKCPSFDIIIFCAYTFFYRPISHDVTVIPTRPSVGLPPIDRGKYITMSYNTDKNIRLENRVCIGKFITPSIMQVILALMDILSGSIETKVTYRTFQLVFLFWNILQILHLIPNTSMIMIYHHFLLYSIFRKMVNLQKKTYKRIVFV